MPQENSSIPQRIKPLEERILEVVSNLPQWDYKVVKAFFPNDHEKSLYRALRKMEQDGSIRYLGWRGRTKQYTTKGISNLPMIPVASGNKVDIKTMFPAITNEYDENFVWWKRLKKLNEFPMLIGQIFTVAELIDEQEFKELYNDLRLAFFNYVNELKFMLEQAENVANHNIMSGDANYFKSIVLADLPAREDINAFKSWLTKYARHAENRIENTDAE